MAEVTEIKVSNIQEKTTAKGGKFWLVTDGNTQKVFTVWSATEVTKVALGKEVKIEFETKVNGNYTNYTVSRIANDQGIFESAEERQQRKGGGNRGGKSPEEVQSIEKQVCLKCAVELASSKAIKVEEILNHAEAFHVWLKVS